MISIPASDFFIGYRKTAMGPNDVLVSVHIPSTVSGEIVECYKQARRRENSSNLTLVGMQVTLSPPARHVALRPLLWPANASPAQTLAAERCQHHDH